MKKLLLFISILVMAGIAAKAQNNGYVSKVTEYIILQGDTIRLDTSNLFDGQVLKRVAGVWTNDTTGVSHLAVDSLSYDSSTGDIYWYISGSAAGSANTDGRYVKISDSTVVYVTPTQLQEALDQATTNTFELVLPASVAVSGRISGATLPPGWLIDVGASPVDLEITHSTGRRVKGVKVFSISGTEEQQLWDAAAYSGIKTTDANTLLIQSFSRVDTQLKVYISFL